MAELVATSTFPPPSIKSVMALTLRDPPNSEIKKRCNKITTILIKQAFNLLLFIKSEFIL